MACSSVLSGGGTNQELVLHCLYECGGDFLVSITTTQLTNLMASSGINIKLELIHRMCMLEIRNPAAVRTTDRLFWRYCSRGVCGH